MSAVLTKGDIFNSKTLNIFTDASVLKLPGEDITNSGALAITNLSDDKDSDSIIDESYFLMRESTNNIGEILAIRLGVILALKYRDQYDTINLFSDSKISLFGLREWFFKWKYNSKDNQLYGSAGTPIANQGMFLDIIYLIESNLLKINLYHTPGHADFLKFIKVFRESNNIHSYMDNDFINTMIRYNDEIDSRTRTYLNSLYYDDNPVPFDVRFPKSNQIPIQFMYSPELDKNKYKLLINYDK